MLRLLIVLLAGLSLTGCFISRERSNEPLDKSLIDSLTVGTSTATEVAETLGAPAEVVQLGRRSAWRYDFTTMKRSGFTIIIVSFLNEDRRSDRCWLFFDADDVLQHVGTTLEAKDTQYAMPWQEVD